MKSVFVAFISLSMAAVFTPVLAATVVDPAGDFLPTYVGPQGADLDVLDFSVSIVGADFHLNATLNGAVGTTAGGFYVIGVNRGGAGAPFAGNGLPGVLFNSVILLRPDGTGTVNLIPGATNLAPGSVSVSGNTISAVVPIAMLPSTLAGFLSNQYGFNLWPRSPGTGFTFISDFAPANSTISAVPEPATWGLMILGFGLAGTQLRRRHRLVGGLRGT